MSEPELSWCQRPRNAKCARCGREPLMGYRDDEGTFVCAVCWDEDRQRFRTPEERQKILDLCIDPEAAA